MSKRWGRNQRRRLHAELDDAQRTAGQARAAARAAVSAAAAKDRELAHLRQRVQYAFDALQSMPNTGLLPAECELGYPRRAYRLPVRTVAPNIVEFDAAASAVRAEPEVIQQLLRIEFAIEYQRQDLELHVHLIVEGYGPMAGCWAYHASALRLRAGIPHDIRQRFAEHIVAHVVDAHRSRSTR